MFELCAAMTLVELSFLRMVAVGDVRSTDFGVGINVTSFAKFQVKSTMLPESGFNKIWPVKYPDTLIALMALPQILDEHLEKVNGRRPFLCTKLACKVRLCFAQRYGYVN